MEDGGGLFGQFAGVEIYIVTGCCAMTELMDRPVAELLRDKINALSGKTTQSRVIIIGDIWWDRDTSLQGCPVLSVGGPSVNSLTHRISEKGIRWTYQENVFGAYLEDNNIPRVALWGQTISDTLKAVQEYIDAPDGLSKFISLCKILDFPIKVSPRKLQESESLELDCGKGVILKLKLIPAGEFLMGSSDGQGSGDEHPQHKVKITKPFYMGIYPVTQAQYQAVTGTNPSNFKGEGTLPVENVSWKDAVAFCGRLSVMTSRDIGLPTEARWEYACRAGTSTEDFFGANDSKLDYYAWHCGNSGSKTHPVGQKKPNPWGLYDICGNVWEWCQDWYGEDFYSQSLQEDPEGPASGEYRVLRGGSWGDGPGYCRSAHRDGYGPDNRSSDIGFRVVLDF